MAKKFSQLVAKMPEKNRKKAEARTQAMLAEMPLHELRRARQLSQETLADALQVKQSGISKLEQRTDAYISTIRRYIEAMGGQLDIVARFPDGDVRINQFSAIGNGNEEKS